MLKTTILVLLVALSLFGPTAEAVAEQYRAPKKGIALYYSPGVMSSVLKVRARQGYKVRRDVDGYTSSTECSDIGRIVLISVRGGPWRKYQVMDCSHPRDRARHIRKGIVAELDYKSALREGFTRNGRAQAVVRYR